MNADKDYGHIKQSRKQFQGDDLLWDDGTSFDTRSAWTWLLQAAAWKDSVYHSRSRMDSLKRGEFVASLRYLGTRWKWDKNRVRRYVLQLTRAGRIEHVREGQHGHIYRIVNYDTYQGASPKRGQINQPREGQQTGQQRDSDEDKVEAVKQLSSKTPTVEYSTDFEILWQLYPKRAGSNPKRRAFHAYSARRFEGHPHASMLEGTKRMATSIRAEGSEGTRYVLQAATFFGPDLRFLEPWDVDASTQNGNRIIGIGGEPTVEELASIGIRL